MNDFITKNVKTCQWCHGEIDRYEHCFQCQDCKSIGDLMTGMMNPSRSILKGK